MTAAALIPVDIGHARYVALADPGTAFWALVDKTRVADTLAGGPLLDAYRAKAGDFTRELHALRFGLKPSAVYVNPTERCNLDCTYCYLPDTMRREGRHMPQDKLLAALDALRGYDAWSVIATCTTENLAHLPRMVELFHAREVPTCMLNTVRCTLPGARPVKPADADLARAFLAALDRSHALYRETGRKLVVANFANILLAVLAPTARRLMCDISPCGGGRAFFALAAGGGLYPCSEFIGLPRFRGGNLFESGVAAALDSEGFRLVTGRDVDRFAPCRDCAIRHFCGSPCPAEAHEMNGGMDRTGAFCGFYKEQVRYAFRLIADGIADDHLWDGWDEGTETVFDHALC